MNPTSRRDVLGGGTFPFSHMASLLALGIVACLDLLMTLAALPGGFGESVLAMRVGAPIFTLLLLVWSRAIYVRGRELGVSRINCWLPQAMVLAAIGFGQLFVYISLFA